MGPFKFELLRFDCTMLLQTRVALALTRNHKWVAVDATVSIACVEATKLNNGTKLVRNDKTKA